MHHLRHIHEFLDLSVRFGREFSHDVNKVFHLEVNALHSLPHNQLQVGSILRNIKIKTFTQLELFVFHGCALEASIIVVFSVEGGGLLGFLCS